MRILGGWIALTPELPAKLVMGRQVWDNAQHADALGKRLAELRAAAQVSEAASESFTEFMDAVEEPEGPGQTIERLVGIYRVLKPHLLAAYRAHLAQANVVYEPPTRRILIRCIEDERRHIAAGEAVLRHLLTSPALVERARLWQERLEALLARSGGVTGAGLPPVEQPEGTALAGADEGRELIELGRRGPGWVMPDGLQETLAEFAAALIGGELETARRWLLVEDRWPAELEARLRQLRARTHRLTALSRIGRHRLVKLQLEGSTGSLTLLTRWVSAADGWRIAALDTAAVHVTPSA